MAEQSVLITATNQYTDEEVDSTTEYPPEYKGPKPIEEQILRLAQMFGLDPQPALRYIQTLSGWSAGAEGYFAIMSDAALAKLFPGIEDAAERYCKGTDLVTSKVEEQRPFRHYFQSRVIPEHLRQVKRTIEKTAIIAEQQPGDIWVIAVQLGMRYRGKSVRLVRELFAANEFGLGGLAVGCIVLTHGERLVHWEQLHMDCPGDEFGPEAGNVFSRASVWRFGGGEVKFDAYDVTDPRGHYGSVSGFVPQ